MPIYMQYPGIEGPATGAYSKWIELNSFQWGVGRGITSPKGQDAEKGKPNVSEIVVSKLMDSASTSIMRESLTGGGKKVHIDFVKTEGAPYLSLELEGTLISSYQVSGHGDAHQRPTESLTLNFTKISYTNKPTAGSPDQQNLKDKAWLDWVVGQGG